MHMLRSELKAETAGHFRLLAKPSFLSFFRGLCPCVEAPFSLSLSLSGTASLSTHLRILSFTYVARRINADGQPPLLLDQPRGKGSEDASGILAFVLQQPNHSTDKCV